MEMKTDPNPLADCIFSGLSSPHIFRSSP